MEKMIGLVSVLCMVVMVGCTEIYDISDEEKATTDTAGVCVVSYTISQHASEQDYWLNVKFCSQWNTEADCEKVQNEGFCTWIK